MIIPELIVYFSYESEYQFNFDFLFFLYFYFILVLLFICIDPNFYFILAVILMVILLGLWGGIFGNLFVGEFGGFILVTVAGCLRFGFFRLSFGMGLRCCVENLVIVIAFCLNLCLFLRFRHFTFFFSLLL